MGDEWGLWDKWAGFFNVFVRENRNNICCVRIHPDINFSSVWINDSVIHSVIFCNFRTWRNKHSKLPEAVSYQILKQQLVTFYRGKERFTGLCMGLLQMIKFKKLAHSVKRKCVRQEYKLWVRNKDYETSIHSKLRKCVKQKQWKDRNRRVARNRNGDKHLQIVSSVSDLNINLKN